MKLTREEVESYMKKVNGITSTTNIKMEWNPPNYHKITYNCPSTLNAELI